MIERRRVREIKICKDVCLSWITDREVTQVFHISEYFFGFQLFQNNSYFYQYIVDTYLPISYRLSIKMKKKKIKRKKKISQIFFIIDFGSFKYLSSWTAPARSPSEKGKISYFCLNQMLKRPTGILTHLLPMQGYKAS